MRKNIHMDSAGQTVSNVNVVFYAEMSSGSTNHIQQTPTQNFEYNQKATGPGINLNRKK
jgi:hypothetical protein